MVFFRSGKKFEWPYFIENLWENTKIRLKTRIKEECRKEMYYQTTRDTHWNLLRITNVSTIKWSDIFHLFVRRTKTRKPVMKGHFRLNINIEGHINRLYFLFRYFKNIWPFLLTRISLNKIFFFLLVVRPFHERYFYFTDEVVPLPRKVFMISLWVILSSSCNVIFEFNSYDYESTYSLRIRSFRLKIFIIHL